MNFDQAEYYSRRYGLTPEILKEIVERKHAKIKAETSPTGCVNRTICHGAAVIPYKLTRMSPDHTRLWILEMNYHKNSSDH